MYTWSTLQVESLLFETSKGYVVIKFTQPQYHKWSNIFPITSYFLLIWIKCELATTFKPKLKLRWNVLELDFHYFDILKLISISRVKVQIWEHATSLRIIHHYNLIKYFVYDRFPFINIQFQLLIYQKLCFVLFLCLWMEM